MFRTRGPRAARGRRTNAMVHQTRPANAARDRIAQQHRVAISQCRFPTWPRNKAEPIQIHVKAEIIIAIATVSASCS